MSPTATAYVDIFIQRLEALGATWERAENPVAARLALLGYLRDLGRNDILAWEPDALPIPGLAEALNDVGLRLMSTHRRHLNPELMVGLTSADAALADTGTLVLSPGPGRSWLPALIVLHHVVLLPIERIFPDMAAWRRAWMRTRPQDVVSSLFITGPSVSDDIELHPHRGMFGPGHMHVLLF
jgi:L-lactate dehydrogenase complex protein LldG